MTEKSKNLAPTLSSNAPETEPEPVEVNSPVDGDGPVAPEGPVAPVAEPADSSDLAGENERLRAQLARYQGAPVVASAPDVLYIIEPEDTWDSLAELHSVNAEELIAYNRHDVTAAAEARGFSGFAVPPLFAGERIRLPQR